MEGAQEKRGRVESNAKEAKDKTDRQKWITETEEKKNRMERKDKEVKDKTIDRNRGRKGNRKTRTWWSVRPRKQKKKKKKNIPTKMEDEKVTEEKENGIIEMR